MISKDNSSIECYVIDFLNYLLFEKNYSINTIHAYRRDLHKLLRFLEVSEISLLDNLNFEFFLGFIGSLTSEGLANSSRRRAFEAVKSFFKFLKQEGIILKNNSSLYSIEGGYETLPEILSVEEAVELIESPIKHEYFTSDPNRFRNAAIFELLYGSGLNTGS